jgi:hypothetical protein
MLPFQYAMNLPSADTPLYSHPLPDIEAWLLSQGCEQDQTHLHCWSITTPEWRATLELDTEELTVRYLGAGGGGQDIVRSFKYSLSRRDLDEAIFTGP